jgi:hypothetical protein
MRYISRTHNEITFKIFIPSLFPLRIIVQRAIPNIHLPILTSTDDKLASIVECGMDLTTGIDIPLEFDFQALIPKVKHTHARVVAGDQQLDFSVCTIRGKRHSSDPSDFATPGVPAAGASNMNLSVVTKTISLVKEA